MPSRDFTDVTLINKDHDGNDDHDDMMKIKVIKFDDGVGYLVMNAIQS